MVTQSSDEKSNIIHPRRPLTRPQLEAILYLADRMCQADGEVVAAERKVINSLAEAANIRGFRQQKWYRDLTDETACDLLDLEVAKRGALVALTLVLKADLNRNSDEHGFFHKVRDRLATGPVTVPVDLKAHEELALEYFRG